MLLTNKRLAEILISAERINDVTYAVQNLEDYFRGTNVVDLYWFARQVEDLDAKSQSDVMKEHAKLVTIMDIAGVTTIEQLEALVLKGMKHEENIQEQIETLLRIKQDLAEAYATLVKSLP